MTDHSTHIDEPKADEPDREELREAAVASFLRRQERFMALLALTSQELPANTSAPVRNIDDLDLDRLSPEELTAVHDYLDAHPEAFEKFLERQRLAKQRSVPAQSTTTARATSNRPSWLAWLWDGPAPRRYAFGLGVAAVVGVAIAIGWLTGERALIRSVERSYASLAVDEVQATLPWERADATLGFGPRSIVASPEVMSFAYGLIDGRRRRDGEARSYSAPPSTPYYALGEWNLLVWTASMSPALHGPAFWEHELEIESRLREALAAHPSDPIVLGHLERVRALLATQARDPGSARNARDLAGELRRFREQFASHAAPPTDRIPSPTP